VKNFFQLAEIADEAARVGIDSGDLETVHHGTRLSVWSCPEPCGKPALNPAPQSALNLRGSLLNSTLQGVLVFRTQADRGGQTWLTLILPFGSTSPVPAVVLN